MKIPLHAQGPMQGSGAISPQWQNALSTQLEGTYSAFLTLMGMWCRVLLALPGQWSSQWIVAPGHYHFIPTMAERSLISFSFGVCLGEGWAVLRAMLFLLLYAF